MSSASRLKESDENIQLNRDDTENELPSSYGNGAVDLMSLGPPFREVQDGIEESYKRIQILDSKAYTIRSVKTRYSFYVDVLDLEFWTVYAFSSTSGSLTYPTLRNGWDWQGNPQVMKINSSPPPVSTDNSYEVDPSKPYGLVFKSVLPPGYPSNAPKVSTERSGRAFIRSKLTTLEARITGISSLSAAIPHLQNPALLSEITETLVYLAVSESGGVLYRVQNNFDIRDPMPPGTRDSLNLPDTGTLPRRTPRGKQINSIKRPKGVKYTSDCGCFQYTATTFRTLMDTWHAEFGLTSEQAPTIFVWDTPPDVQVYIQAFQLLKDVYIPCFSSGIPSSYRAICAYLFNAMPGPTRSFISRCQTALAREPNANETRRHLICRQIYDAKQFINGSKSKQLRFHNNCAYKMAISSYSVVQKFPALFNTNKRLLPNIKRKM